MRRETPSPASHGSPARRVTPRRRGKLHRHRPELTRFEEKVLPSGIIATGSPPGLPPIVHIYDAGTGKLINSFEPYPPRYRGGVEVGVGDFNDDGTPDIVTVNGAGARPIAQIFDGTTGALLGKFAVAPASYRGGVSLAVGDVNGDGIADVVVADDQGQPWVTVFEGPSGTPIASFLAYGAKYRGGVRVAVGDFNHDGLDDIATVNASGVPEVKVFAGGSYTTLADIKASDYAARGGASIAAGDVNGDRTPDLIVAQAAQYGKAAEVKVFDGDTSLAIADFGVYGRGFATGARVAAIDVNGDHTDEIAVAAAGGGGVVVYNTGQLRVEAESTFNQAEGGVAAPPLSLGTAPPVLYQIPAAGVGSLAATSSVTESTPVADVDTVPASGTLTPLQRLAVYDRLTGLFNPVEADDPGLAGKDVYVLVHGWAPGYQTWVDNAAKLGQTLTWWETFPGQVGYNPNISGGLAPASAFLLDGLTASDGIVVSPMGMAQEIDATDPKAVVLAYSWIDDSATPVFSPDVPIPEDADIAEGKTELNGMRLAYGLEQALGPDFTGKLQLIGHSYGSKVATVAALALQDDPTPIHVNALSILDSPEASDSTVGGGISKVGAANYNWYFLESLDVNRADSSGTFVENVISEFDQPYDTISYPGSNPDLANVVDVDLYPYPFYGDFGYEHTYAAAWYAGSADPLVNDGQSVGLLWSPLLAGNSGSSNPPASLSPAYEQSWYPLFFSQSDQYDLETYSPSPTNPNFNPIALPLQSTPGVNVTDPTSGAVVALAQTGGTSQSYTGSFDTAGSYLSPEDGIQGITFQYAFPKSAAGDVLTISIDGVPEFVMDAYLLQSPTGLGTLSVGDILGDQSHTLTFTLTSTAANSTSSAVISDIRQFNY
jgi:pimeloyl-ACP methyl ester carboxylesterase